MEHLLYVIRHAQSTHEGTFGDSERPLSKLGQTQAECLAELLLPLGIRWLYSSPYVRARATIAPFADRAHLRVHLEDDLRERKIVRSAEDDFLATWDRSWQDFEFALPDCESNRDAQTRFVAAVRRTVETCRETTLAICTHGAVIGLLLNWLDPSVGRARTEQLRNPDVLRFHVDGGRWHWDREFELPGLAGIAG